LTGDTTLDGLLNRSITLEQPAKGYRVAIDTVFLAAAVPAQSGQRVLEFGCGVGGAMLCLGYRVAGLSILGVEKQQELAELCERNIERNTLSSILEVRMGDVLHLPSDQVGQSDHVMMNPPYHEEAKHDVSAEIQKRLAHNDQEGDLEQWIANAARALKPTGVLTLIHRADREEEIRGLLQAYFGKLEFMPLTPKQGMPSKRLLCRAYKGEGSKVLTYNPFILHEMDGHYTEKANRILRQAEALIFDEANLKDKK
jgi:tRNA1(Val) A37 N6-methylase TrmN6